MKDIHIYDCLNREGYGFPYLATSKRDIIPEHSLICEEYPVELLCPESTVKIANDLIRDFNISGEDDKHNAIIFLKKVFCAFINTVNCQREENK